MSKKIFMWKYSPESVGGSNICRALPAMSIFHENSKFQGSPEKIVINWGSSALPDEVKKCKVINKEANVIQAANKLSFFKKVQGAARIPEFTESLDEAMTWVKEGKEVLARTILNGHSGKGIVFFSDAPVEFAEGKLFTVYKKKKAEFRVHIIFGDIVLIQKKALRQTDDDGNQIDPDSIDFRVQNLKNGFIFKRNDVIVPQDVRSQALLAYEASGLDFGAFDVIWNEHENRAYVLEVNTAPGLEGTTIFDYSNRFAREFGLAEKNVSSLGLG